MKNCPDCFKPYTHTNDVGMPDLRRPCETCMQDGAPPCPAWEDGRHCFETGVPNTGRNKYCACGIQVERTP